MRLDPNPTQMMPVIMIPGKLDSTLVNEKAIAGIAYNHGVFVAQDEELYQSRDIVPVWQQGMARYRWFRFYEEYCTTEGLQEVAQEQFELGYHDEWQRHEAKERESC